PRRAGPLCASRMLRPFSWTGSEPGVTPVQAAVEQQRRVLLAGVQVVDAGQHHVVVAGRYLLLDGALQPADRAVEPRCPAGRGLPGHAAELVGAAGREAGAELSLVLAEDVHAEPVRGPHVGPAAAGAGHAEQ